MVQGLQAMWFLLGRLQSAFLGKAAPGSEKTNTAVRQ